MQILCAKNKTKSFKKTDKEHLALLRKSVNEPEIEHIDSMQVRSLRSRCLLRKVLAAYFKP
jgi:hypothetical protein